MIKVYDFVVLKMVEKRLSPKEGELAGATIYKVLYLLLDEESFSSINLDTLADVVSSSKDFYIGYVSNKDSDKISEGMFVRGFFDEKGKIKLLG